MTDERLATIAAMGKEFVDHGKVDDHAARALRRHERLLALQHGRETSSQSSSAA
jgi:hypothetical protein